MNTKKNHTPVAPGGYLFGLGITVALMALGTMPAHAASFTWTGAGGTTAVPKLGNWNAAANWNGTQAVSASDTELDFATGSSTAYTSTDNITGAFQLNILTFTGSSAGGTITVATGASSYLQFVANGSTNPVINANSAKSMTLSGTMDLANDLTIQGAGSTLNLAAITGAGKLIINRASGAVQFGGAANSYTGGTEFRSAGTTVTTASGQLGSGTLAISGGGAWQLTGAQTHANTIHIDTLAATINAQSDVTLSGSIALNANLTVNQSTGFTGNLTGEISGAGNLTKSGTGTVILSSTNTYTGQTAIQAGILSVSSLNSVSGGVASSSLGAPTTVSNGTITIGSVASTGQLTYTGTGETTDRVISLIGRTGGATIDQSGTGLLKFTSSVTTPGVASYDSRKTLTLQGSTGGTGEIAGIIADSTLGTTGQKATSVTKAGTGTWTLSGNNTYTGSTTVSAGTLQIGDGISGSIASGSATVASGATLAFNQGNGATYAGLITDNGTVSAIASGTNTLSGDIGGSGAFSQTGSGRTILSGNNSYGGVTTVSAGELDINGTSSNSSVNVSSGATLGGSGRINGSVTVSSGTIQGSGLTFAGSTSFTGASTLAGTSTATNGYTVTSGTLSVTGRTSSGVTVNGGVLQGAGTVGNVIVSGTLSGTLSTGILGGSGLVSPGNSPGILTATSLESGNSLSFAFELAAAKPNYASATGSLNDVLHVTSSNTGLNISSNNAISIFFSSLSVSDLAGGITDRTYEGGFYVDGLDASTLLTDFKLANVTYYVADSAGGITFNDVKYSVLDSSFSVIVSSQTKSTDLGLGSVLEFAVVPEPSTWAMLLGGIGMLAFSQRLRRRTMR